MKITHFATGNINKLKEVSRILGYEITQFKCDLPETQDIEIEPIILEKAKAAFELAGEPILVEDTGLFCSAWNGFPGGLIKWEMQTTGNAGIIKKLDGFSDRSGQAVTIFGFWDGEKLVFAKGITKGTIATEILGDTEFGWDPIFIPDGGGGLSFAQMIPEMKDEFSMRRKALEELNIKIQE